MARTAHYDMRDKSRQGSRRVAGTHARATRRPPRLTSVGVPTPRAHAAVTSSDILAFRRMFVFHPHDYAVQRFDWTIRGKGEWQRIPTERHPALTDTELRGHLDQREALAVYAARRARPDGERGGRISVTRHLLIDLDLGAGPDDLRRRAAAVRQALGEPTFVLSSPSGGAHLVYLFERETPLFPIRGPGGNTGSAILLLKHRNLAEKRGVVEVFPGALCWLAPENVCRLPFGPGAYLLDPETLSIVDGAHFGVRALRFVGEQLESGDLEYADPAVWAREALALPIARNLRPTGVISTARERAQKYLDHGLPGFGERRRAVLSLAYYWWWQGKSEEEATRLTQDWLESHHNNNSRDWNASRNKQPLLDDCQSVVEFVYERRREMMIRRAQEMPPLTCEEVRPITELALRVAERTKGGQPVYIKTRTKSVRIDPVKLVEFGVLVLQHCAARLHRLAARAYEYAERRFDARYASVIERCRPDYETRRFRLPISARLMMSLPSGSERGTMSRAPTKRAVGKDSIAAYMRFLAIELPDIFSLASDYFAQGRKCRDFYVRLDVFGARVVSSGSDAWIRTDSVDRLEPLVSRYVWKEKLEADVRSPAPGWCVAAPPVFALQFVRDRVLAAVAAKRSIALIKAGVVAQPVAPDWVGDDPARHLKSLPEATIARVLSVCVTLSHTDPLIIAPFVLAAHLDDLSGGIQEVLADALHACFPEACVHVSAAEEPHTPLRVRCSLSDEVHQVSDQRLLNRATTRATEAAIREAVWRARLHMRPSDFDEEETAWKTQGLVSPPR